MEKLLNDYLARVERYLNPLSASDRVDIVKEIKSEMLELLGAGVAPEQIVERLGDAKTLARAYLSDNVAKAHGWRRVSALIAFYSLAGLGGICVLPVTSICAAAFLFSGAVCPLAGIVKLVGMLLGFNMDWIGFQFGSYSVGPFATLLLSILLGAILFFAGWLCWKLTVYLVKLMGRGKRLAEGRG